jgi:hypothetical protein
MSSSHGLKDQEPGNGLKGSKYGVMRLTLMYTCSSPESVFKEMDDVGKCFELMTRERTRDIRLG